jgi:hypothetical protein
VGQHFTGKGTAKNTTLKKARKMYNDYFKSIGEAISKQFNDYTDQSQNREDCSYK